MKTSPVALTIAGSDSSGGAGIQADLKTFSALGVYGASVITAITAQNTRGVQAAAPVDTALVAQQIESVLSDLAVSAIKTGMLHNESIIKAVCSALAHSNIPLVVDPVMVATSGDRLLSEHAVHALRENLLPLATLVTPNLGEAAVLLESPVATSLEAMETQGIRLLGMGCHAVLMKGGHLAQKRSADILVTHTATHYFEYERIETRNTHGTGCTFAAAIAAMMAQGAELPLAVLSAKEYLHEALLLADTLAITRGSATSRHGPVHHFYRQW